MSEYATILYETGPDGVVTITLNRPESHNGLTVELARELRSAISRANSDPGLRVMVLTGAGRSFCPGADLKHFNAAGPAPARDADDVVRQGSASLIHESPLLTVAAVNGACAGAGFGIACACDIRVAARSAVFRTAFLDVAVAGDYAVPWSLPRLVGAAKARELAFFCERFSAEEAQRIGLVARLWDDGAFRGEVAGLAATLAAKGPIALRAMKDHYNASERMGLREFEALELERHHTILKSEDTAEGFRAFVEKRPGRFVGR
jgi:2-(1,2-epoxy-1,2-dihydrophenyl)acetyl-CoA isomerase